MGYTHHWTKAHEIDATTWKQICADARKLIAAYKVPISFEHDRPDRPPAVDRTKIRFNGQGRGGYETFILTPEPEVFAFCKTDRKPYDSLVCAVLAAARDRTEAISVKSDGDAKDWQPTLSWASAVLGRPLRYPVTAEV